MIKRQWKQIIQDLSSRDESNGNASGKSYAGKNNESAIQLRDYEQTEACDQPLFNSKSCPILKKDRCLLEKPKDPSLM